MFLCLKVRFCKMRCFACSGCVLVAFSGCFVFFSGGVAFVVAVAEGEKRKAGRQGHYSFHFRDKFFSV